MRGPIRRHRGSRTIPCSRWPGRSSRSPSLSSSCCFPSPSFAHHLNTPPADITVKATGKQWYWTYAYPDNGKFEFDSLMLQEKDRKADQPRLLAVDNEMVVPVNKVVRVQTIGAEVIHSFAIPSFGIRIDAVPGRLNETWFKATREGVYYGQCSELCGKDHAFMPIAVRVVSEHAFNELVDAANKRPDWKTTGVERTAPTAVADANPSAARERRGSGDQNGGRTGRRKELTMATPATTHGAHDDHGAHDHGEHANPTGWRRFV